MFRMMVVDDERWIRERLVKTVDWAAIDVEIVSEAEDGEEAFHLSQKLRPDIILTDIRMPCIDGLELIKLLQENGIRSKVVIISGFSDFEYAQKAVRLGAFDYILKPVDDDDLTGVVRRCIRQITQENVREDTFRKTEDKLRETEPILRERFFSNLVNGYYKSEERVLGELRRFGVQNEGRSHICYIIQIDGAESMTEDIRFVQFILCNIAKDFNNRLGDNEQLVSRCGEVVCILSSGESESVVARRTMSISSGIRRMIRKVFGCTVTIGIGRPCGNILEISSSYQQARRALLYKAYLGQDSIYDSTAMDILQRTSPYRHLDTETLVNRIKIGDREGAFSCLEEIIAKTAREGRKLRPIDLKIMFVDILISILKAVGECRGPADRLSFFSLGFFEKLNRLYTLDEMRGLLRDSVGEIIGYLESSRDGGTRKIVKIATDYIQSHYNEPITLNEVAGKVYLNPSYFCKVFKNEMGEPFTRYLMKLRVHKAIELMNDPQLKIYEIAEKVGYSDVQYFTKMFKSIQGVVPKQYRDGLN